MASAQVQYNVDYREALQLAINREVEAENFYGRAADKVHQADPKSLLRRLAIQEKKHQQLLRTFSDEVIHAPKGVFVPPSGLTYDVPETALKDTEQIFRLAIDKEEESLNFYARFLVYFFGTGHEKTFFDIFEMERDHKEQLERNLENFFRL